MSESEAGKYRELAKKGTAALNALERAAEVAAARLGLEPMLTGDAISLPEAATMDVISRPGQMSNACGMAGLAPAKTPPRHMAGRTAPRMGA